MSYDGIYCKHCNEHFREIDSIKPLPEHVYSCPHCKKINDFRFFKNRNDKYKDGITIDLIKGIDDI